MNAQVVRVLLGHPGVSPGASGQYALKWASGHGHSEVVKLLLGDERVDPRADKDYALRWAQLNGHADVAQMLIRAIGEPYKPCATRNSAASHAI